MKKILVLLMCVLLVCMTTASALADFQHVEGTLGPGVYKQVTPYSVHSHGNAWRAGIYGASSTQRVKAQAISKGRVVGGTYIYSGYAPVAHQYNTDFAIGSTVALRACLDPRDQGSVTISGYFWPNEEKK